MSDQSTPPRRPRPTPGDRQDEPHWRSDPDSPVDPGAGLPGVLRGNAR